MRTLMLIMWDLINEKGIDKSEALKEAWAITKNNRKIYEAKTSDYISTIEFTNNQNEFYGKGATKQVFRTTNTSSIEKEFITSWVPKSIQKWDSKKEKNVVPKWFVAKLENEFNIIIINA